MSDIGVLTAEDRVELIDGVLIDLTPQGPTHSSAVARLTRQLARVDDFELRVQDVLLVAGGFVIPDLMLVARGLREEQPSTAALAIEIAVTSLRHDTMKADRYAAAGVSEYWLVDMTRRQVTVHRDPAPDGYQHARRHGDGAQLEVPRGATPVDVSELFGARLK